MDDEATYEDQHGSDWEIQNDHQTGHEETQEPNPTENLPIPGEERGLRKYSVIITATVTASATVEVEAQSEEAARADVRAQLDQQGSQATTALVEATAQVVRKDELDDLNIDVEDND